MRQIAISHVDHAVSLPQTSLLYFSGQNNFSWKIAVSFTLPPCQTSTPAGLCHCPVGSIAGTFGTSAKPPPSLSSPYIFLRLLPFHFLPHTISLQLPHHLHFLIFSSPLPLPDLSSTFMIYLYSFTHIQLASPLQHHNAIRL